MSVASHLAWFLIIVLLLFASYIAIDSTRYGMKMSFWFVFVFLTGFFGAIIYIIESRKHIESQDGARV